MCGFWGCGLAKGIHMNKFMRIFGLTAIALCAVDAHAELEYSPNNVFDPESGLSWRVFETLAAGQSAGFSAATVAQTAELFSHYAPQDNGGVLPGYHPAYGNGRDYTMSGNDSSYSVLWESYYFDETGSFLPPSLINLGSNVHYGGAMPRFDEVSSLAALAFDGVGWSPVLIRSTLAMDQYGSIWGHEEGFIDPNSGQFSGCDVNWDNRTCSNPYLDDNGAIKIGGYLMISNVPER
jgi:hypothetical protein